jgi:glutamate-1-semialdehyde 2,1-aminomutase
VAAGRASLQAADENVYRTIDANADRLHTLISQALEREGVAHHIQRASNMLSIRFAEGAGYNFADMKKADTFRFAPFFHTLLDNGVYAPPSVFETWFVSSALTDDDFQKIENALVPAAAAAAAATA